MGLLDDDDGKVLPLNKGVAGASPRQEAEVPASSPPTQVILDIRKDIQKFQDGGQRKELVEALRDQFVATRHQAGVKAEAVRMLALDMLKARLPEIKSVAELMRAISALSRISENDLAAVYGVAPGAGPPLLNIQQMIGHEGTTGIAQRFVLPRSPTRLGTILGSWSRSNCCAESSKRRPWSKVMLSSLATTSPNRSKSTLSLQETGFFRRAPNDCAVNRGRRCRRPTTASRRRRRCPKPAPDRRLC
jgi:hypothetical protein